MLKEPPFADSLANGSNRDEDLLTVDDELVAVAFGMGADGLEVAAGVRFRHAERADRLAPLRAYPSSERTALRRHRARDQDLDKEDTRGVTSFRLTTMSISVWAIGSIHS